MDELFDAVGYIAICITLVSAFLYSIRFANNSKTYRIFTIYLLVISVIQLLTLYVGKGYLHRPNLFLSHFYFGLQFILLSLFYFELLRSKLIKVIIVPVMLFLGYQFIADPELFYRYNPLGITITQAILVIYTMLYFYRSLAGKSIFVIVNIGVFFYLLSSTLIFASGNLVLNLNLSTSTKSIFVDINRVLILLFQILIIVEWYRNYRHKSLQQ